VLTIAALALRPQEATAATQVQARLSSGAVEMRGTVTLVVSISDPKGGVGDPQVDLPPGVAILGSARAQNFSFVNGRANTQVEFRYEIGGDRVGHFQIGPIRVRVGDQVYVAAALPLEVTATAPKLPSPAAGGPGGGNASRIASLVIDVQPSHPYVGELVQLTVRLVQRVALAEDSQYEVPPTPGFWGENYGDPRVYEGREGGRMVAVTERKARLYPLAAGVATVGQAAALVVPASSGIDPFFGSGGSQPVQIHSESLHVNVRPLPGGAPAGFDGAVGEYAVSWTLDRSHTAQDQPITLDLDVRGSGNLPLIHTPAMALQDFEVFTSTIQDSLAPLGERSPSRRRFQWTLMPKHAGTLHVPPIEWAWFEPRSGAYRRAALPPLSVEVLAADGAHANDRDGSFPERLAAHGADPGARGAWGWAFLLAGALAGLAVRFWVRGGQPDALAAERARQREWLRAVGLAHGPDFWRAADESVAWVESRGGQVLRLREDIAAARYGGQLDREDDVRRRLVERISEALPAGGGKGPWRPLAIVCALAALLGWALGAPQHGDERLSARARTADRAAREGRPAEAAAEWARLWDEAPGSPALAARLAWHELSQDSLAEAATWVLRGQGGEARDPALGFVAERVREAGALTGAHAPASPLRSWEWAALASALALGCLLEWPRRWSAILLGALAIAAVVTPLVIGALRSGASLAVVRHTVTLDGAGLDLDAGQVVRVLGVSSKGVSVSAGRDLAGVVPPDAVRFLNGPTSEAAPRPAGQPAR
jgi:hypothetical protein